MKTPILIINLKTYEDGSDDDAARIANSCEQVAQATDTSIAVAVQNADLHRIANAVNIPVLSQHLDPHEYGSNTGKDIAETLAYNGADGVLINHSEDQLPINTVQDATRRAHDNGMTTVVCVDKPENVGSVDAADPDFIAYEPPELIGGDISVSDAEPELVQQTVNKTTTPVLCGAGINDTDDVTDALQLGTDGVLVASGVVKAADPEQALRELVAGFQQ